MSLSTTYCPCCRRSRRSEPAPSRVDGGISGRMSPCWTCTACPGKVPYFPIIDKVLEASTASKYAEWVDQTVGAYRGTAALRRFRVLSNLLGSTYATKIYSWLEFSLRQGVEVVELYCYCGYTDRRYTFPSFDPSLFPNLRLLKSLTLKAVYMPDDSLNGLLSACEFLERLHLAQVPGLVHFVITGPALRLKHIHIAGWYNLRSVMIHAPTPDLVSFTYPLHIEQMTLQHAPLLVELQIRVFIRWSVHPLFRYLSQLESLHLTYFPSDMEIDPVHGFPVLSGLKHLKMDFDGSEGSKSFLSKKLRVLESLPEIAPFLQHLTVEVDVDRLKSFELESGLARLGLGRPLPVRVLEIEGFKGSRGLDLEPALRLVRACPSLEKLVIRQRNTFLRPQRPDYDFSGKARKVWEERVKEVFRGQLPSKAKLVLI